MPITLSTGEEVHLLPKFTHQARKESKQALGIVWKENEEGQMEMVKEIPEAAFDRANEIALLCMIEKIVRNGSEAKATQEWLDRLSVEDSDALLVELLKLKRGGEAKKKG